jgi:hypothetical protein
LSYIYHETLRNKLNIYKISQYPSLFYILSNLAQPASRLDSTRSRLASRSASSLFSSPNALIEYIIDTCFNQINFSFLKRPNPLGLKCDTITSLRRLVNTFIHQMITDLLKRDKPINVAINFKSWSTTRDISSEWG